MDTRPPSVAATTRWMSVSVAVERDMKQTTGSSVCALEAGGDHHAPVSSIIFLHRCRNRGAGVAPLFGLVARVQVLVILHTRYAQNLAGVGGASWWMWLEWSPHLNFASYTHVLVPHTHIYIYTIIII